MMPVCQKLRGMFTGKWPLVCGLTLTYTAQLSPASVTLSNKKFDPLKLARYEMRALLLC